MTAQACLRPEPAPMGLDDGPADAQPHAHAADFVGGPRLEDGQGLGRCDAGAAVQHLDDEL